MNSYFNNRTYAGKPGFIVALMMLLVTSIMTYNFVPTVALQPKYGICFPSVGEWQMPHFLSWSINLITTTISAIAILWFNRVYRFIHENTSLFATSFVALIATNPWLTFNFGSPALFTFISLIAIAILFEQHGSRNTATGLFLCFSSLAFGSMFDYAFALMIPIFAIAAMYVTDIRLRQIVAIILGIIAPYWILIGFGIVRLSDFRMPDLNSIFFADFITQIPLSMMISIAITALFTLLLALNNSLKIFATNSQTRAYNSTFNLIAIALFWYMIFDFSNFTTYMPLFFLMTGIQATHFFINNPIRHASLFLTTALSIYITLFCLCLYA